jgi:hypothetical protein
MPTRCNRLFLLKILLLAQHVSGTTMPIIRSSKVLYKWLLPVVFGALVFKLSVWCGAEGYVSGLRAVSIRKKKKKSFGLFCGRYMLLYIKKTWCRYLSLKSVITSSPSLSKDFL